jgi:hypothetical protein
VPPPLLTFGFSARTMESLRKWKAPSMDCLKRSPGCTRKQDCPWQQQPCCKVSVSGTLYSDDSLGKANTVCHTAHCAARLGFAYIQSSTASSTLPGWKRNTPPPDGPFFIVCISTVSCQRCVAPLEGRSPAWIHEEFLRCSTSQCMEET